MNDEDTREELDETLKESNDSIMKTVDAGYVSLPLHNRLTLVNNTDKVLMVTDLMKLIIHNEGNPRRIVSEILDQVWRQTSE